jgi:hypothetical protein
VRGGRLLLSSVVVKVKPNSKWKESTKETSTPRVPSHCPHFV